MKKQFLIILISICSIFTMNAQNWSGSTPGEIYYNLGNVGIGTTTPEVSADITTAGSMLLPNSSGSTNTGIQRVGYANHTWAGVQLDMGIYNHSVSSLTGYPAWIQARNPVDYSVNRNLLLNPNGGYIGVGTKTPQANADISTAGAMLLPNNSGSANTAILRVGYTDQSWAGVQLDMGIYNHSVSATTGYPAWIQARNPADYSENRNLLLNPNGGNIGIGTTTPTYKLDVCGIIRAKEIKVDLLGGCDFVFNSDYNLMELSELDNFVKTNKHLPEIAPEKEMIENGLNMKDFQMQLLLKIEELTLYTIEQDKAIDELKQIVKTQNERIEKIATSSK